MDLGGPAVPDRVPALGPAPAGLVPVGDRVEPMVLVAAVVLAAPRLGGPVVLVQAGQGARVVLMVLVAAGVLVAPRLVGRAVPVEQGLVAPAVLAPPVAMAPVDRAVLAALARRAAPVDRVELMSQVDRAGLADRVELTSLVAPADLVAPAVPADPVAPAVPNLTGLVDPVDRGARADRHRRRTSNTVSTTTLDPRWAAPGTCPTDSARPITGRRLGPGSTDSAGTVGLPPVLRRHSGTDRRLQVAGAGLRLLVVGTPHGTGRRAMSQSRSVISGRLVTTGTTRFRCSTRCSAAGASGCSVCGFRCTDLTARLTSRLQRTSYEDERSVRFARLHETASGRGVAAGKNACGENPVQECPAWLCTKAGRSQMSVSPDAT